MKHKRKSRRKVRYSKHGVPFKYDGGNLELARILKKISDLYKQGKRVPQSLIARRIKLGKRSLKRGRRG